MWGYLAILHGVRWGWDHLPAAVAMPGLYRAGVMTVGVSLILAVQQLTRGDDRKGR